MDGTLVDSRISVERTWRRWAALRGVDSEPLVRAAQGRRTRDSLADVVPAGDLDREVAWLDAAEFEDLDGTVEVPGARVLLSQLPASAWAVVTSAGRELAQRRLTAAGLPVPQLLISSEDVIHGKPAPEGYLLAAVRIGVELVDCLVFEDAPPGIAAGLAAGLRVVALATTQPADRLTGVDAVIRDFREVQIRWDGEAWMIALP
jgi:sugar-phosphatase